jgi:lipopolysaccharide/colanic/teichoic acid biosynthesis glycosyltransferase
MSATTTDLVMPARAPGRAEHEAAWTDTVRRVRDITGSLLLLFLTLPLCLLVACLIKLESRGPVMYRQERVGLRGKVFTLLKFRSMRVDAEAAGPRWATERDPRITRVGTFIRAQRIDELPQLLNVLRGDMSLVGPRPERPCFTEHLAGIIPRYDERAAVLPGLTGLAQVRYAYGASVQDARLKLDYDLRYIATGACCSTCAYSRRLCAWSCSASVPAEATWQFCNWLAGQPPGGFLCRGYRNNVSGHGWARQG